MRVCLVTNSSLGRDPRALAEANSIREAGHEVVGVSRSDPDLDWVTDLSLRSASDRLLRRATVEGLRRAARTTRANLYIPVQPDALEVAIGAARDTSASYLTKPTWSVDAGIGDLIREAPSRPELSLPATGAEPRLHVSGFQSRLTSSVHSVAVVYRRTERNPGRYLEEALRRRGMTVVHTDRLAWDELPSIEAVIVVESPLPALEVSGKNPGIPVVFWVHHGEHHLDANVRLQRRYRAHAVALAHSWHLSYRFFGYVDRLPFGVASELTEAGFRPHDERPVAVAFVGSQSADSRYGHRKRLLEALRERLGDGVTAADSLPPEEMMSLYRNARIVPDDSWGRHRPITMRVFEATGAGALLVTREAPGLEMLLERDHEYVAMTNDAVEQIADLAGVNTGPIAADGHATAWQRHTYDRRVDDLLSIIGRIRELAIDAPDEATQPTGLARAVAAFSDAQRVIDLEGGVAAALPTREVWDYRSAEDRAEPGTFHVAVVAGGGAAEWERVVAAARLAVVAPESLAPELEDLVEKAHGPHRRRERYGQSIFTFGSSGYRASSDPDPM